MQKNIATSMHPLKFFLEMFQFHQRRGKEKSKECVTFEEFVNSCTSKRYTLHRIRRVILCSILGIKDAPSPEYIRVLALSQKGAQILKDIKKANITVRNFPQTVSEIRNKTKIKEGGELYLFFTTIGEEERTCIVCKKI